MAAKTKTLQFTHSYSVNLPGTGDDWTIQFEDGGRRDDSVIVIKVKNPSSFTMIDRGVSTVVSVSGTNYNRITVWYDSMAVNVSESYKLESDLTS